MRAGNLDTRASFRMPDATRNEVGELVPNYVEQFQVWGDFRPDTGGEYVEAAAERDFRTAVLTIRYRTGVLDEMRVFVGGVAWDIDGIVDPGYEKKMLRLKLKTYDSGY